MKKKILILISITALLFAGCHRNEHFISNKGYRAQVHSDFLARQEMAANRADALFACMDTLDIKTREALEFLYAYMPYSDLADYDQSFYLQQIRAAFAAREHFSWGKKVPEDIFRHFVLVYRVNNENLDTARMLMQRELAPRVERLSMYDAALEVNHWCHEYVAYRASDGRTSAPLATMRTSLGRCGEESTFTVTALRSVGIPARQCYTPRWAHCDDNHAWVEVYIADSNKWYFLGACEPDPELDMGWFAVPSTRCMMVHSKAFGLYNGDEEVVKQTELYSELNLLSHYAPTKKVTVTVYDSDKNPVEGANVKFKLYNYSEFYTLATIRTDNEGRASLTTGLGDLLVWATDGEHYSYSKLDVRNHQEIALYLTRECGNEYAENIDIAPPVAGKVKVMPSEKKNKINERRKAYEDSLRLAYTSTFHCESPNPFVRKSEGNWAEIEKFITRHPDADEYLSTFSDKDMRDITCDILEAHLTSNTDYDVPIEAYKKGILPARISNEMIRPWRKSLKKEMSKLLITDANTLNSWMQKYLFVDNKGNYFNCPISPIGVYELRHCDSHSRDIFFVAACRAVGTPAYLDNATNTIYIWDHDSWKVFSFEEKEAVQPSASLTLKYTPTAELSKPTYWTHFSLAKYDNGDFTTFDFEEDPRMDNFPTTITLEPGYYCLTTGNRYPEGDVLTHVEYFSVQENEHLTKDIVLLPLTDRKNTTKLPKIDATQEIVAGMATLAEYAGSNGILFAFMGDYKEPSKHLVKEMQALSKEYKAWGGTIYLVAPANAKPVSWKLPNADCIIREATDKDTYEIQIEKALKLDPQNDYPFVALVNNKGEITFSNHGYSIGLAEQILKHTKKSN